MKSKKNASPEELGLLYQALASQTDENVIAALLEDLCTIREIHEMAQRLTVARLLANEYPYTAISEITGASATTIARVSKSLNYGAGGYRVALGLDGTAGNMRARKDPLQAAGTVASAAASDSGGSRVTSERD